jgi:hypothetical protein
MFLRGGANVSLRLPDAATASAYQVSVADVGEAARLRTAESEILSLAFGSLSSHLTSPGWTGTCGEEKILREKDWSTTIGVGFPHAPWSTDSGEREVIGNGMAFV